MARVRLDAVARRRLPNLNKRGSKSWWNYYAIIAATSTLLTFIDLSLLHDTRWSPEGTKATLLTLWSWPWSVFRHSYVWKSHSLMDMSAEQEANSFPPYIRGEYKNVMVTLAYGDFL